MSDAPETGWLDRVVDLAARGLDALGLNGTRLRWRWNRRRKELGEAGLRSEILWRSTRVKHKMCPGCRALVPRGTTICPDCDTRLEAVAEPGLSRLLGNLIPGARTATSLIFLANGFWFMMMLLAQAKQGSGGGLGLMSAFDGEIMFRFGAGDNAYTWSGNWWRLITPIFLHAGILHFFFNSYLLIQLGPICEEEFGTERFWVLYLLCGIAGGVASQMARPFLALVLPISPRVFTVGASGAIMGLIGLLAAYGWKTGGSRGTWLKTTMVRYAIYILLFSLLWSGVDHLNHLGGLLAGALLGWSLGGARPPSRTASTPWKLAALGGVLLVLYGFYAVAMQG